MGSTLYWKPKNIGSSLPDELKRVILKRYENLTHDKRTLDVNDLDYLEGLQDAEVAGAKALVMAIKKHGSIEISIEY